MNSRRRKRLFLRPKSVPFKNATHDAKTQHSRQHVVRLAKWHEQMFGGCRKSIKGMTEAITLIFATENQVIQHTTFEKTKILKESLIQGNRRFANISSRCKSK